MQVHVSSLVCGSSSVYEMKHFENNWLCFVNPKFLPSVHIVFFEMKTNTYKSQSWFDHSIVQLPDWVPFKQLYIWSGQAFCGKAAKNWIPLIKVKLTVQKRLRKRTTLQSVVWLHQELTDVKTHPPELQNWWVQFHWTSRSTNITFSSSQCSFPRTEWCGITPFHPSDEMVWYIPHTHQ